MSTFFNSRFPAITLGGAVIQILLFPCAKVLEYVLPDWGITVFGTRHSLNPGPWTFKEQSKNHSFHGSPPFVFWSGPECDTLNSVEA